MKRIIDQTSEPWSWASLQTHYNLIKIVIFVMMSVILSLSSTHVVYPVVLMLLWNYYYNIQRAYEQLIRKTDAGNNYIRGCIAIGTLFAVWELYRWQGVCLAIVSYFTSFRDDDENKKVRGFKRIHVDRERFNSDVLKPGEGCVRETKT